MKSLSKTNLRRITEILEATGKCVYTPRDLDQMQRATPGLNKLSLGTFCGILVETMKLRHLDLKSANYPKIARYCRGNLCPYELALTIKPESYLSHASAAYLHALLPKEPTFIYVNAEQGPKPRSGSLTQEALDRSFALKQRTSNFMYRFNRWRFVLIRGKHTKGLGVETLRSPSKRALPGTNLERTLIDLVVRTAYAGGVRRVFEAYCKARGRASTDKLVETLEALDFVYPYHQAIGFYMERAGYAESGLAALMKLGSHFDFYLTHGIQTRDYDAKWRIYYPAGVFRSAAHS